MLVALINFKKLIEQVGLNLELKFNNYILVLVTNLVVWDFKNNWFHMELFPLIHFE
jgi:hypothetical protein